MVISTTQRQASSEQAQFFSYGEAANPIRSGLTSVVPYRSFSPTFFAESGSAVLPLDLSAELDCDGPATGPSLCANFVRVHDTELVNSCGGHEPAVFRGRWRRRNRSLRPAFHWSKGDMLVLPAGGDAIHTSRSKGASTGCTTRHCCAIWVHTQ